MTRSEFLRARRPEHKQQRRDAILDAARDLARESGVRSVSLGAVAEAVGIAKSNISRYFRTREEIYLVLLAEEWESFAGAVAVRVQDAGGEGADGADDTAAIAALAETMVDRPLFCDLLSHLPTSLEYNVSADAAREFKRAVRDHIGVVATAMSRATTLTDREAAEIVYTAGGLGGLLYRAHNPPPVLAQVYRDEPDLAVTHTTMLPTLVRMLSALAAGLPTLRGGSHD